MENERYKKFFFEDFLFTINNFLKIYGPIIRKEESKDKGTKNILSLLTGLRDKFLDLGYLIENTAER
jgi:hypothetical protein